MDSNYNRDKILQGLLSTLQNMLSSATNDNWDEVEDHNKRRLSLSDQLRSAPSQQTQAEKQIITELCDLDLQVLKLAKKSRDAAASEMHDMNGRKSNVNQYLQNQFNQD